MSTYIISQAILPKGFRYPKMFIDMVKNNNFPVLDPWFFIGGVEGQSERFLNVLRDNYPERKLVPFAAMGVNDDMSCFDGSDNSGDPKVIIIHLGTEPGWEGGAMVKNFADWVTFAKQSSEAYWAEVDQDD